LTFSGIIFILAKEIPNKNAMRLLIALLGIPFPPAISAPSPVIPVVESVQGHSLETRFAGEHLVLLGSGKTLTLGRNKKSGVWRLPARQAEEMWVARVDRGTAPMRLHPQRFQRQLRELLADYPEVHGALTDQRVTYQRLDRFIPALDEHLARVREVRFERRAIQLDRIIQP
jgi:hypothetical protein